MKSKIKSTSPGLPLVFGFVLLQMFVLDWYCCQVEGSYSVMGFRSYTPTHFQTVLELYKMYDRSFHIIHTSRTEYDVQPSHTDVEAPSWTYKKQTEGTVDDEETMERPDELTNLAMENELFHTKKQAANAYSLAEPLAILTVQYLSLMHAIQFGRGFTHYEKGLKEILESKSSTDRVASEATIKNLLQTSDTLKRVQSQFKKPEATVFDPENFFDRDFQKSVKMVGLYFREAALGKTIISYEQVFDWTEMHPELWTRAAEFLQRMRDPHEQKYLNLDSGQEDAFKSNVVSILRSIELYHVQKNFGDKFVQEIWKGLEKKFLIAKPTGKDGKLRFHEQSHGHRFPRRRSESVETTETSAVRNKDDLILLGTRKIGNEHNIRMLMEIMKICTKGEDYAVKSSVWMQEKHSSYWKTYFEKSEFGRSDSPQIRTASKNVYWQSYVATYLTDLYSIFFVQYLASIYSVRFAYGFAYFKKENKPEKAAQCAKVAYFLARYGIDSELILLATEELLSEKYPEELTRIWHVKEPIRRISRIIHEKIVRKYEYDSFRAEFDLETPYFENEKLTEDVQTLNLYFRDLIFSESNEEDENVVDINGTVMLWNKIDVFDDMIDVIHTQSYVNLYPGIADTFANAAVSIVQFAEILSASGNFQNEISDLVPGLKKEDFLVKRRLDRKLQFTKVGNRFTGK